MDRPKRIQYTLNRLRSQYIETLARDMGWEFEDPSDIAIEVLDEVLSRAAHSVEEISRVELLDADEIRAILSQNRDLSDDDLYALVRWAEGVRTGETLLNGVMLGKFDVCVKDGEPVFTAKEEEEKDGK